MKSKHQKQLGHNVGGYRHGGTVTEKASGGHTFKTGHPLDTSDHKVKGEYGKDLPVAASGEAGGYDGSTGKG